jgi:hypothetical protein
MGSFRTPYKPGLAQFGLFYFEQPGRVDLYHELQLTPTQPRLYQALEVARCFRYSRERRCKSITFPK